MPKTARPPGHKPAVNVPADREVLVAPTDGPAPPPHAASADEFRRRLAGLMDPHGGPASAGTAGAVKDDLARLVSILWALYGGGVAPDAKDRTKTRNGLSVLEKTGRIDSAIQAAVADAGTSGDVERFVQRLLEHVKYDPIQAGACEPLGQLLLQWDGRDLAYRQALVRACESTRFAVVARGKRRWEERLAEAQARKAAGGSGEVEL